MKWMLALVFMAVTTVTTAQTSPDDARVTLASLTDGEGAIWTLAPGTDPRGILRNGAGSGLGTVLVMWQGTVYTRGGDLTWYRYVAPNTWAAVPGDPSLPISPIQVAPLSRLAWFLVKEPVARAISGNYLVYIDGVAQTLPGIVCTGVGTDSECSAPLPALKPGEHTLAVSHRIGIEESKKSNEVKVTSATVVVPSAFSLRP